MKKRSLSKYTTILYEIVLKCLTQSICPEQQWQRKKCYNIDYWSAGIYWEQNKFPNRTFFAPYAYKTQLNTRRFLVEDLARLNTTDKIYTNQDWYKELKSR
jgi:hypothetical protein